MTARSARGAQFVDVTIAVRDDDGSCHVDLVDLVPNATVTDLRFRIDLVRHTVTMLDATRSIMGGLGSWWSDGLDAAETARVVFNTQVADH